MGVSVEIKSSEFSARYLTMASWSFSHATIMSDFPLRSFFFSSPGDFLMRSLRPSKFLASMSSKGSASGLTAGDLRVLVFCTVLRWTLDGVEENFRLAISSLASLTELGVFLFPLPREEDEEEEDDDELRPFLGPDPERERVRDRVLERVRDLDLEDRDERLLVRDDARGVPCLKKFENFFRLLF